MITLPLLVFLILFFGLLIGFFLSKTLFTWGEFRRLAEQNSFDSSESKLISKIAKVAEEENPYPLFLSQQRFRKSALEYMKKLRSEVQGGKELEQQLQSIFKLEEKLFSQKEPKRYSTRDFPVNQPLHLHPHNAPKKRFNGAIWKKNRSGIGILYDDAGHKGVFQEGTLLDIHFQLPEEGVIHITAEIEKLTEKPAPMLVVRHQEGLLREEQRREYIRVPSSLFFKGTSVDDVNKQSESIQSEALIPHEGEDPLEIPNSFKGEIIDMSAGGMRFTTETVLKDGNLFIFDVKLPPYTLRNILARIISIHIGKKRGHYIYHADFIGINAKKTEMISAYVIEQELAEYNASSEKKHAKKESS